MKPLLLDSIWNTAFSTVPVPLKSSETRLLIRILEWWGGYHQLLRWSALIPSSTRRFVTHESPSARCKGVSYLSLVSLLPPLHRPWRPAKVASEEARATKSMTLRPVMCRTITRCILRIAAYSSSLFVFKAFIPLHSTLSLRWTMHQRRDLTRGRLTP